MGRDRTALRALWRELGARNVDVERLREVARLAETIRDRRTGRVAEEADLVAREALRASGDRPSSTVQSVEPAASERVRGKLSEAPAVLRWPAASAALLIVGAFGPWERFFVVIGIQGTDTAAGWICIGAAGLAVVALRHYALYSVGRRARASMASIAVLGLVGLGCVIARASDAWGDQSLDSLGVEDAAEAGDLGDVDLVTLAWGSYLTGLASVSLAMAGVYLFARGTHRKVVTAVVPPSPAAAADDQAGSSTG
jgi:hypothetical protein